MLKVPGSLIAGRVREVLGLYALVFILIFIFLIAQLNTSIPERKKKKKKPTLFDIQTNWSQGSCSHREANFLEEMGTLLGKINQHFKQHVTDTRTM